MARTKKLPPQSAEDVELAKETIAAALADTTDRLRAELADVQAKAVRLQQQIGESMSRETAWIGYGTIDETRALDAHTFATRDMHNLAKRVLGDRHLRLDPDETDAARRKHEVVRRYLADRNLLPAALVDPNWRPNR